MIGRLGNRAQGGDFARARGYPIIQLAGPIFQRISRCGQVPTHRLQTDGQAGDLLGTRHVNGRRQIALPNAPGGSSQLTDWV